MWFQLASVWSTILSFPSLIGRKARKSTRLRTLLLSLRVGAVDRVGPVRRHRGSTTTSSMRLHAASPVFGRHRRRGKTSRVSRKRGPRHHGGRSRNGGGHLEIRRRNTPDWLRPRQRCCVAPWHRSSGSAGRVSGPEYRRRHTDDEVLSAASRSEWGSYVARDVVFRRGSSRNRHRTMARHHSINIGPAARHRTHAESGWCAGIGGRWSTGVAGRRDSSRCGIDRWHRLSTWRCSYCRCVDRRRMLARTLPGTRG
jgi:hypothetical protein